MTQRMATGNDGLEEFYRLLLLVRRNRDVIGSLNQGAKNLRPMGQFKFIEEDLPKRETPAQIRNKRKNMKRPAPKQSVHANLEDVKAAAPELEVTNG